MTIGFYVQAEIGKIMAYDDWTKKKAAKTKNTTFKRTFDGKLSFFRSPTDVFKICRSSRNEKNVYKRGNAFIFRPIL